MKIPKNIARMIYEIRVSVAEEEISYDEIAWLQGHAQYINRYDHDLAQFVYDEEDE